MAKTGEERRIGVVGILVLDREGAAGRVNGILSEHGGIIVARTGIPYRERGVAVMSVIIDATVAEVGAMTGKLGMVAGVRVKSLLM